MQQRDGSSESQRASILDAPRVGYDEPGFERSSID
jgi:hypothetical protein